MAGQSESVNSLKFVVDKVSFVNKLQLLSKATSDDENPTPGYMYQEMCNLTTNCGSFCSNLLDYLVSRLDKRSYHVKLKVLRIMRYIVDNGHSEFRQGLRRQAHGIRDAMKFGGPPDPLHGNAPYILVRKEAKELCLILFNLQMEGSDSKQLTDYKNTSAISMGMGSHAASNMQGFGNTTTQQKSLTESLVGGLRDLAIKVMDPVPSPPTVNALSSVNRADRKFSDYKPVQFTEGMTKVEEVTSYSGTREPKRNHRAVKTHRPGVAGGGWEDSEEEDGDDDSLNIQQRAPLSDHQSETITETTIERLQTPSEDYASERLLVAETINKDTLLMKRTDIEEFIKRCSSMNCVKVVETIGDIMVKSAHIFQLHGLQLCESLLRTELVSPDELAAACKSGLNNCYRSQHKQTKVKARKVIRILEKLCINPNIISDVILAAENDANNAIVTSSQTPHNADSEISQPEQAQTCTQPLTSDTIDEDLTMSSFDLIKPPFANTLVTTESYVDNDYHQDTLNGIKT